MEDDEVVKLAQAWVAENVLLDLLFRDIELLTLL